MSIYRFVMSICIPALELFLHTVRGILHSSENRVHKAFEKRHDNVKYWRKTSFWIKISRVWLPLGYLVVALAILLPGIINVTLLEYI